MRYISRSEIIFGENPLGTPKFLALSDLVASRIKKTAIILASASQEADPHNKHLLRCLIDESLVAETIRIRIDTIPGYGAALKDVRNKIFPSLVDAEGFDPQSDQYWNLATVAATNLSTMVLSSIRGE